MSAKQKNGIAALEEFLQEKYVEKFEDFEESKNRIANFVNAYPEYFYVPRIEGFGMLDYIEYEGKAFYLIKKENLPEEIREGLVGGDAGQGEYTDYVSLNDVYGVNSSLKVYYCSGGLDSIQNLGKDDVDNAVERDVFEDLENKGLGKLLSPYDSNKDGKIQSSEISSITELEVTENIDLKDIYNLYSLEKLIIKEVQDVDLSGIENCMKLSYIWFFKSSAKNYEPIGKLGEKLNNLYFSGAIQSDVEKLCSEIKDYELIGLTHLAFFGSGLIDNENDPLHHMEVTNRNYWDTRNSEFTSLIPFNYLKDNTKKAIKYLWLFGNKFANLDELTSFENLIYLNVYGNNLNDINGLKKCADIEYLRLADNTFTDNDVKQNNEADALYVLQNLKNLFWLDIAKNSGVKYIDYLSSLENLKYLYMDGCGNLSGDEVVAMSEKINSMTDKTYDSKYQKKLLDPSLTTKIEYGNQTLEISDLLAIGNCTKLTYLDLSNVKVVKSSSETVGTDEDTVEELMKKVFKNLTELQALGLNNFTINFGSGAQKISNLNFLQNESSNVFLNKIRVIDLRGTDVHAGLNITTDLVSKNNADILNNLTNLKLLCEDNPYFDFSNLQTMLNRFDYSPGLSCGFIGGNTGQGLVCRNLTSLETLENCTKMTRYVSFNYVGSMTVDLDLSRCTSCTWVYIYNINRYNKVTKKCAKYTKCYK